jgi:hypothetical protein
MIELKREDMEYDTWLRKQFQISPEIQLKYLVLTHYREVHTYDLCQMILDNPSAYELEYSSTVGVSNLPMCSTELQAIVSALKNSPFVDGLASISQNPKK